jgi:hypothetical protein
LASDKPDTKADEAREHLLRTLSETDRKAASHHLNQLQQKVKSQETRDLTMKNQLPEINQNSQGC